MVTIEECISLCSSGSTSCSLACFARSYTLLLSPAPLSLSLHRPKAISLSFPHAHTIHDKTALTGQARPLYRVEAAEERRRLTIERGRKEGRMASERPAVPAPARPAPPVPGQQHQHHHQQQQQQQQQNHRQHAPSQSSSAHHRRERGMGSSSASGQHRGPQPIGDYDIVKTLGTGSFGKVKRKLRGLIMQEEPSDCRQGGSKDKREDYGEFPRTFTSL